MKRILLLLPFLLVAGVCLKAQDVYKIYDGCAPGMEKADYPEIVMNTHVFNVTVPTVTVYKPDPAINTGAAVIIAPGGGNMFLTWEEEGVNVAQWFQRHGITGIILKYRTTFMGNNEEEIRKNQEAYFQRMFSSSSDIQTDPALNSFLEPTMQGDDGRQAVRFVREHAAEWGVHPQKIGLIGFSAGGALTCNVMYINDDATRPDFVGPIYGVFSSGDLPAHPVPTMMIAPEFDLGGPRPAFQLYEKFQAAHLPCEIHYIFDATHGQGLLYNGREWNEWIDMMYNFMKAVKFVE